MCVMGPTMPCHENAMMVMMGGAGEEAGGRGGGGRGGGITAGGTGRGCLSRHGQRGIRQHGLLASQGGPGTLPAACLTATHICIWRGCPIIWR